jgi:hypothetical protein
MMMQILEAGGREVLTDNMRKTDSENPRGYYEYEPVKKIEEDNTWLEQAQGKVVKMVYRLLYELPGNYAYRVIIMQRDIREVLASQRKMLVSSGYCEANGADDAIMSELFEKEVAAVNNWLDQQKNLLKLCVEYKSVIDKPVEECGRVNEFLGGGLDVNKMVAAIDVSLYRNRL